jgi:hypothetical protein
VTDKVLTHDRFRARLGVSGGMPDDMTVLGRFHAVFREASGRIFHEEEFDNLVTTLGKNFLLDTTLAGSSYTVVGPYMGLICGASAPTIVAADTMASHAGWLEGGTTNPPTYSSSGARIICVWSAASAGVKALSAGLTFTFTGSGTVQGGFIVTGSGAVTTNLSTAGTLYSAGALSAAQPVVSTNTLTISYSTTLT